LCFSSGSVFPLISKKNGQGILYALVEEAFTVAGSTRRGCLETLPAVIPAKRESSVFVFLFFIGLTLTFLCTQHPLLMAFYCLNPRITQKTLDSRFAGMTAGSIVSCWLFAVRR
jgi:hypothetical protein